ncbi:MAG: excinuclease ABC subunit UvrC [Deferribacterales bacterium]
MLSPNLEEIPEQPGIYTYIDGKGKILYVGKALNLRKRIASYFNSTDKSPKTINMLTQAKELKFIVTSNEKEALLLENNIIKNEKPKYNVRLKDAKSYPFIKITNAEFPKLMITRNVMEKDGFYYGPFVDVNNLRFIMSEILKIFPIRTCTESRFKQKKICLNYQIKKCSGPCEGLITKDEYEKLVSNIKKFLTGKISELKEYFNFKMQEYSKKLMFEEAAKVRDTLFALDKLFSKQGAVVSEHDSLDIFIFDEDEFFSILCIMVIRFGKLLSVNVEFLEQMDELDPNLYVLQYYTITQQPPEKVAIFKNRELYTEISSLKSNLEDIFNCKIDSPKNISKSVLDIGYQNIKSQKEIFLKKKDNIQNALDYLCNILNIGEIQTIECIDISHLYGTNTVGASICWTPKGFEKSKYRKYRIKLEGNDDFYAIYELMKRKGEKIIAQKEEQADLYLIDGGIGQLNSALKGFKEAGINANIISISKGRSIKEQKFISDISIESIHLPNRKNSITLKKNNPTMLLLQMIRDEAHRFVIEYMRKSYEKLILSSELLEIKGIGEKRLKKILTIYPDIFKRVEIPPEELSQKCNIPMNIAEKILNYIKQLH